MKITIKFLSLVAVSSLILFYGCEKNPSEPDEVTELTETEQMEIIVAEISQNSGGIMADIEMASTTAKENSGGLAKTVWDTTLSNSWLTFSLSLSFFDINGNEQSHYIENETDKIVFNSSVTGEYDPVSGKQYINLNRSTNFDMTDISTEKITFNGTSNNSSLYNFTGVRITLDAAAQSTYTIENLVVDSNSPTYLPLSGRLEAMLKGTYNKESLRHKKDVEYKINFVIEFNGGNEVTVTLASGTTFTLNLVTGAVS